MTARPERRTAPARWGARWPLLRQGWPPRLAQVALGLWMVLTVFLWPHSRVQAMLALACGGLAVLLGVIAMKYTPLRLLLGLVGAWLLLGTLFSPGAAPTVLNNLVVAALLLALSFLPIGEVPLFRRRLRQQT